MSIFSIPDDLIRQMKQFETMNKEMARKLPAEMASAVNLMAHPMAGAAAMSALSFGMASQAFGIWMGAVSSAAETSRRMFTRFADEARIPQADARTAAARASGAASKLIADTRSKARKAVEAVEAVVAPVALAEPAAPEPAEIASPVVAAVEEAVSPALLRPKSMDKPDAADDLKAISGIGPKLEKVLNGLGVWTLAQIAGWTAAEAAWVDDYLAFKGRIGRDGWVEQASKLAGVKLPN